MITQKFAEHFAQEWVESWNSHDLKRILSHYTDDFVMSSPFIPKITDEASGTLKGKDKVGAYWAKALQINPTADGWTLRRRRRREKLSHICAVHGACASRTGNLFVHAGLAQC